jgi:hypothetical protein
LAHKVIAYSSHTLFFLHIVLLTHALSVERVLLVQGQTKRELPTGSDSSPSHCIVRAHNCLPLSMLKLNSRLMWHPCYIRCYIFVTSITLLLQAPARASEQCDVVQSGPGAAGSSTGWPQRWQQQQGRQQQQRCQQGCPGAGMAATCNQ